MNALKYDAVVIGNHEFNYGLPFLRQAIAGAKFPYVSANVRVVKAGVSDRVDFIVKLLGMVNAPPDFTDQPKVINGCSDLFVEVLGEAGKHARSAVGMGSLPMGIPVEIECIVEVA